MSFVERRFDFSQALLWFFVWTSAIIVIVLAWILSVPVAYALIVVAIMGAAAMVRWTFQKCLVLLLVVLSAIGLPNKLVAITLPNGDNLIGIRDVLIVAAIVAGLFRGRENLSGVFRHPLLRPGIWLTVLTPFAAIVGLAHGGNPLIALRETFTLISGWLLAVSVAANVRDWRAIKELLRLSSVLGVLVAIGATAEILSGNRIKIVSQFQEILLYTGVRNWPDGFIFMFFSWSLCGAFLLTKGLRTKYTPIGVFVGLAILLTGARGYFYSYVAAMLSVLALAKLARTRWIKAGQILSATLLIGCAVGGYLFAVSQGEKDDFADRAIERYVNIASDAEGRLYEFDMVGKQLADHPFVGAGLGVKYRDRLAELFAGEASGDPERWHDTGTLVHNIFAYFLLRYGPLGMVLFAVFAAKVARSTYTLLKEPDCEATTVYRLGVCIFLIYCLIEAQAGNIFGDIRQMPIVSILLGLLAAMSWVRVDGDAVNRGEIGY